MKIPELKWASEFPVGELTFGRSNPPEEPYYYKQFVALWHVCTKCLRFVPEPRGEACRCSCGKIGDVTVRKVTLRANDPKEALDAAKQIRDLGPAPFGNDEVIDLDRR